MFKSARWRSEKNKIKAVFKLQFHATQVAQVGGDALVISVVPADIGKATVRLEKGTVRDGSYYWENPVYETVKFVQELKSGKIHERIYHFVVGHGSSKAGVVGEASIDFSSYAEATKGSSVSLPLKNSKSGAVLHVSIQRIQDCSDQRQIPDNEDAKLSYPGKSLGAQLSNGNMDGSIRNNSVDDTSLTQATSQAAVFNRNYRASSESDVTISSSESSSGLDTPRELKLTNNNIHEAPITFLSSVNDASLSRKATIDGSAETYEEHQKSQWEWLNGSTPEESTDGFSGTPTKALLQIASQESTDIVVEKLKSELISLSRQAALSELELQTLRKQIVKESKRGQDLSREIFGLKQERDAFKKECEELKAFQRRLDEAKAKSRTQYEGGDLPAFIQELRQELDYEKELNANMRIQLEKTQESNSELILAVRDLDEMLEQKNNEMVSLSNDSRIYENNAAVQDANSKPETDDDEEQKALEELVREHKDAKEEYLLEQKIMDLQSEIEIYRRVKDELEMQMEQIALDYEILKQENHELSYKLEQNQLQEQLKMQYECTSSYATINELEAQIESLDSELKKRTKQLSDSLATIKELETHNKMSEEELETQAQAFEADLEVLTRAKVEQEQRAIRAEEALRRTRWQNANTAERLQEEFKRLSVQMASTFEANEKLASKALTEANELRLEKSHLEEMLRKASNELQSTKDHYETQLHEMSGQVISMSHQIERMKPEIEKKSNELQYEQKSAEKSQRLLSQEILMLKAEVEKLTTEKKNLYDSSEQNKSLTADLEKMRTNIKKMEYLIEQGNRERIELEGRVSSVNKETEDLQKELDTIKSLKDEKELVVEKLQLEVDSRRTECNELKHSLSENELEKEKLKKQLCQFKSDLKKKEDTFNNLDKKLKDSNGRVTTVDGMKGTSRNNKSLPANRGAKEVASLKETIKLLESQIRLKEIALETSSNSFLEKEKDLYNKIGELETRLEILNQQATRFCDYKSQEVAMEDLIEEFGRDTTLPDEEDHQTSFVESNGENEGLPDNEIKTSTTDARDLDGLLNEIAQLRERNKLMEDELKEMQGRYSEISLKFAEVEGERQQLVMKLRNIKNARRSP